MKLRLLFLLFALLPFLQLTTAQTLPRIDLTVLSDTLSEDIPVTASFTITYYDTAWASERVESYACLVNLRGATSMLYDKNSMEVRFVDSTGNDLDVNLLGIRTGLDKYILDAAAADRSHIRNRMAMDIFTSFARLPYSTDYDQRYGTVGRFVEVWIEGEYEGLFCLSDPVNRKLLGCKKPQNGLVRGVLYKCGSYGDGAFLESNGTAPGNTDEWNAWTMKYPNNPTPEAWLPLQQLMNVSWDSIPDSAYAGLVQSHFYYDNLVDVYLFVIMSGIGDFGYKNCYLACPNIQADSRFVVVPWDLDHSLGSTWNACYMNTPVTLRGQSNLWRVHPFRRLLANEESGFYEALATRWYELKDGPLSVDSVCTIIQGYATQLDATQGWQHDRAKWNDNPIYFYETAQQEADYMILWYQRSHARLTELLAPYRH